MFGRSENNFRIVKVQSCHFFVLLIVEYYVVGFFIHLTQIRVFIYYEYMETEAELIYKIICGDEDAFMEIYNKYSKMLISFVYRHTNSIDETSDIVQEVFVRLLENIRNYNPKGSFKSYIFTIALNVVRDRKRKESYERKMMPKVYESSTKDDGVDSIYEVIDSLDDYDKNILLLRLDGYKIEEIAEILGVSDRTVNRCLKKVINKLKSKGGFYE